MLLCISASYSFFFNQNYPVTRLLHQLFPPRRKEDIADRRAAPPARLNQICYEEEQTGRNPFHGQALIT